MKRLLSLFLIITCILTGCATASPGEATDTAAVTGLKTLNSASSMMYEAEAETVDMSNSESLTQDRKLIKTIDLNLETLEFDSSIEEINKRVEEFGGYIASSNINGKSIQNDNSRYASFTLKIPTSSLEKFLNEVNTIGNIIYQSENISDVTMQYSDTEAHLNILRTEQESLTRLLEQAETMEDILSIRTRLSEIEYEIESYQTQLNNYDNQIDYTAIYLNIEEVILYSSNQDENIFKRMTDGIKENFIMLETFITNVIVLFVSSLPTLILLGVIIFMLYKIVVACKRRRLRKLNQKKVENDDKIKNNHPQS
mgnify:CR=1 FL=1